MYINGGMVDKVKDFSELCSTLTNTHSFRNKQIDLVYLLWEVKGHFLLHK